MKKKLFLLLTGLILTITTLTGCGKEEVSEEPEIVQGEVQTDESRLISLLIDYINEDLMYNNNFSVQQYTDSLESENLYYEIRLDQSNYLIYTYLSEYGGIEKYYNYTTTYWYDKTENIWKFENKSSSFDIKITDYVPGLLSSYDLSLGDDTEFNSTDCYTLNAVIPFVNEFDNEIYMYQNYEYYIDKDTYTLLGVKDIDNECYTLINYGITVTLPDEAKSAVLGSYNDYIFDLFGMNDLDIDYSNLEGLDDLEEPISEEEFYDAINGNDQSEELETENIDSTEEIAQE